MLNVSTSFKFAKLIIDNHNRSENFPDAKYNNERENNWLWAGQYTEQGSEVLIDRGITLQPS